MSLLTQQTAFFGCFYLSCWLPVLWKRRFCLVRYACWAVADGQATAIAIFLFLISAAVVAADTPPPPFQLPTYREGNAHQPLLPIVRKPSSPSVKKFDPARAIELTANCWPAKSWFRPELSLEARGGQTFGSVGKNDQTQADYVGIVARIPLYSPAEIDREREREALRMQQAATNAGKYRSGSC